MSKFISKSTRLAFAKAVESLETRVLLVGGGITDYSQGFETFAQGALPQYAVDPNLYASIDDTFTSAKVTNAQAKTGSNSVVLSETTGSVSYLPQMVVNNLGPQGSQGYTTESVEIAFDYFLPAVADQPNYLPQGVWISPVNDTSFVQFGEVLIKGNGLFVKNTGGTGGGYIGPVAGGEWHHVLIHYDGVGASAGDMMTFSTTLDALPPVVTTVPNQGQTFWNSVRFEGRDNDANTYTTFLDNLSIKMVAGGGGNGGISGNVWNDSNSNGTKDGAETNIAGWVLYLDTNNNSVKDGGEASATTDASGNYTFSGLANGTYHVKQVSQTGTRKTKPVQGTAGYDVNVAGATVSGNDFGNTTNIFLGGKVYNDANSNGVQDGAEAGIPGVTVNIISNASVIASRTTIADGSWKVQGLSAGTGQAKVIVPVGFTATNPASTLYSGSASSGERLGNLNFGLHSTGAAPALVAGGTILGAADSDLLDGVL